jgi:transposase-like protein
MPKPKRRQRSAAEVQQILRDLANSGVSRRQFAISRGISLSTLQAWVGGQRRASGVATADVIAVGTVSAPCSPIEIELPGGEIVRLMPGCPAEDLRVVLAELRRC